MHALKAPLVGVLASAVLGLAEPVRADPPSIVTLADAVRAAIASSDAIAAADRAREAAGLSARLAHDAGTPKISSNLFGSLGQSNISNQTYGLDLAQTFLTGTQIRATVGAASIRNQLGNFYNTDTTLLFTQPLLRSFGASHVRRTIDEAEAAAADAARQRLEVEEQVALEAAAAYYRLIAQQQLVSVARRAEDRARTLLTVAAARLAAGRASQLDVVRAEHLVSHASRQRRDAHSAADDARDELRFLMGSAPDDDIVVDAAIPAPRGVMSLDEAQELARQHRRDITAARMALKHAEDRMRFVRADTRPQVDFNLMLTRRESSSALSSGFGLNKFNLVPFASVSMPFDRTAAQIERQRAALECERRRRELQTVERKVALDARRAVRDADRLAENIEAAAASVALAERELDVATLRFGRGLATSLDVTTAENNLFAARSQQVAMEAERAVVEVRLRARLGVLDISRDFRPE